MPKAAVHFTVMVLHQFYVGENSYNAVFTQFQGDFDFKMTFHL